MFPSPFVACAKFPSVYTRYDKHHQLSSYLKIEYHESIFHHFSAHLIVTASKLTMTKSSMDSCLPCATPKYYHYVPVKSKLQHPPPPGNPRAFEFFAKIFCKFPPPEAEKLFKCPIIGPFQVIKCPHHRETFR